MHQRNTAVGATLDLQTVLTLALRADFDELLVEHKIPSSARHA
jgi:hypothetical protein